MRFFTRLWQLLKLGTCIGHSRNREDRLKTTVPTQEQNPEIIKKYIHWNKRHLGNIFILKFNPKNILKSIKKFLKKLKKNNFSAQTQRHSQVKC